MRKKLGFFLLLFSMFFAVSAFSVYAEGVIAGSKTEVDLSHVNDGYVSVRATAPSNKLKVIIEKSGGKYTYDLSTDGSYVSYPLQMGDGKYNLKVAENVVDSKFSVIQTCDFNVQLSNQFAPFLNANVFVDYKKDSNIVRIAQQVCSGCTTDLEKLDKVYSYVAQLITYDTDKASNPPQGYIPRIDSVLSTKKGICFDYAAVMAAMLRSQNIPTKLVTGYVSPNNAYHAWNEAYIKDVGWVKTGELYFDGTTWKIMDPTFLSSSKGDAEIQKFIGNGGNYAEKYQY